MKNSIFLTSLDKYLEKYFPDHNSKNDSIKYNQVPRYIIKEDEYAKFSSASKQKLYFKKEDVKTYRYSTKSNEYAIQEFVRTKAKMSSLFRVIINSDKANV